MKWLWWSVRGWQVGGVCGGCERVPGGRWLWRSVRGWQVGVAVVECERVAGGSDCGVV